MKKFIHNSILMLAVIALTVVLIPSGIRAHAATPLTEDGKYEVPIDRNMKMGQDNFSDKVILEKQGNHYYMTFDIVNSSAVPYVKIALDTTDKIGTVIKEEGKIVHNTYSLQESVLLEEIPFTVFVNAMKTEVSMSIKLHLDEARKIADTIDDKGERPAIFVPDLKTTASDGEVEKGTFYKIETATATMVGREIPVDIRAYYKRNGETTDVEIKDGQILLENVGEYHIVYRAETDLYKTNLDNNSFTEIDIKLISKIGAESYAKIEESGENKVLPDGAAVQANLVKEDSPIYQKAKDKMEGYSDKYEVLTVTVYDKDGNTIQPTANVLLYLKANPLYDRNKAEVYFMSDDGEFQKLDADGYGRYMKVETDKVGNFLICQPGVEFVMPMWGYATITIAGVVILIALITVITVVIVKKKKKNRE